MVPPVETTATGIANLTFDNSTSEFTWEISHSLPLSDVIGAHIREGEVGENGGIVIPLDHTENPMVGAAALTGEQAADQPPAATGSGAWWSAAPLTPGRPGSGW